MYTQLWIIILSFVSTALAQIYKSHGNASKAQRMVGLAKFEALFTYAIIPDIGYEPYWIDGDYKIHDPTVVTYEPPEGQTKQTTKPTPPSTKQPPMVCGEECHLSYRGIMHVCTHHTDNNWWAGCWRHGHWANAYMKHCWNEIPDVLSHAFVEFKTYCEYLEATCRDHYTKSRYILMHIGKCKDVRDWFVIYQHPDFPLVDFKTAPFRVATDTPDPLKQIKTVAPTLPPMMP